MSIRLRLTVILLAIALIPLLFVSALTFNNYKSSLERTRLSDLRNIAAFKAEKIETYFAGLKADVEIAQASYVVKKNLPVLTRPFRDPANPELLSARKAVHEALQKMPTILGLSDIMLVNPQGKIVYTTNSDHYQKDFLRPLPDPEQKAFAEGRHKVYFSDIFLNTRTGNRPGMLVTAPASDLNGAFAGVVALEVDAEPIYKLIQDVTGLGDTGETLVAKRMGNEILFLNALRHDPDAALKKRIRIGDDLGIGTQNAAQGDNGTGQFLDYRGKKVVGAWRYIPSLDWGIVAKIDAEEAFADVTNLTKLILLILAIIVFLSGITAFSIAQSIADPIKRLSKGAEIIGSGNLDYQVGSNLKDEIGQLSRTFDKMTQDIKRITAARDDLNRELEQRVADRTTQLEAANRELEAFSYSVSHDLRAPLRGIDGFSQALLEDYSDKLDDQGKNFLQRVRAGSQRMAQLIDDLLNLSRVTRSDMNRGPVNLSDVASKIAAEFRDTQPARKVEFIISEGVMAEGDDKLLYLVLENLLSNAWKFTEKNAEAKIEFGAFVCGPSADSGLQCCQGTPVEPHIPYSELQGKTMYFIKDNGIGFDMSYSGKLGMPFQRLHSVSEYPGTGIGLATVKRIIHRHGGNLWMVGEVGKGATVYFTLQ